MLSESARMTTARAASFRVNYPNSAPRAVKVVALDKPSAAIVRELAKGRWQAASFFTAVSADWDPSRPRGTPIHASLVDLQGRHCDLVDEIGSSNLVVMIGMAGEAAEAASLVAEVGSLKRVMITGLLMTSAESTDEDVARTLKALRPYAPMLVVSSEQEYIAAMLTALRA